MTKRAPRGSAAWRRRRLSPPPPIPPTDEWRLAARGEDARREMAVFDSFPAPIREILATSAYITRCLDLGRTLVPVLRQHTVADVASYMAAVRGQTELATLRRFALEYEARHGSALPHVAARATIMR